MTPPTRTPHPHASRQRGQAIVEATVALAALAGLLWAVSATGGWQDDALRAGLAAREAAFAYSRFAPVSVPVSISVTGVGDEGDGMRVALVPVAMPEGLPGTLPTAAQPGGAHLYARVLRRDWGIDGAGAAGADMDDITVMAARAEVVAAPRGRLAVGVGVGVDVKAAGLKGLDDDSASMPTLARHTVVLRGAGHAADDASVQARIAASNLGWQRAAQASQAAGQTVAARLLPVDAAWTRPAPDFDWLQKWSALGPSSASLPSSPSQQASWRAGVP